MQAIGGFKLAKGLLLVAVAVGGLKLLSGDWQLAMAGVAERLSVDPGNRYFQSVTKYLLKIYPKLPLVLMGTFAYGSVFSLEGMGLLFRRRWAEYLTVIVTGSFLPLEIYELVRHKSLIKGIVIALNLAIVIYLVVRLKRDRPAR